MSIAVAVAVVGAGLTAAAAPAAAAAAPYAHATRATTTGSGVGDPTATGAPTPDYCPACAVSGANSQTCINAVVTAINNARALEGVSAMVLPAGVATLSTAQQTLGVSHPERVDRGLQPADGMVSTLNGLSTTAANSDADPKLPDWSAI